MIKITESQLIELVGENNPSKRFALASKILNDKSASQLLSEGFKKLFDATSKALK